MTVLTKIEDENTKLSKKRVPSPDEVNLICIWWDRKKEISSGLAASVQATELGTPCLRFDLENMDSNSKHYQYLLKAKVYDGFGVSDMQIALDSFTDCINLITTSENLVEKPQKIAKKRFEMISQNVLNLFQELRPRDSLELMLITKLIILNHISNIEFIGSVTTNNKEDRTIRWTPMSRPKKGV